MNIYQISGLGASVKVFDLIDIDKKYKTIGLPWLIPHKGESLQSYAKRMAKPIDKTKPFILMGLSFGGIIAQEIHKMYPAEKIILISSLSNKNEKSFLIKFSNYTKIHRIIPVHFFTSDKMISYAFFRKVISKRLPDIQELFIYRDPYYLRWSIDQVVSWNPSNNINPNLYLIQGSKDPLFRVKENPKKYIIKGGTHLIIMLKATEISKKIKTILDS